MTTKNTVDVLGGSSPAPWFSGPPNNTPRLDSADLGSDAAGGQQDACRSAVGASKRPTTYHEASPRLSLASRAGSAWSPDPLVHQRRGCRCFGGALPCRKPSKTLGSLLLPALQDVHATSEGLALRGFLSQSKEFLELRASGHYSSEGTN